MPFARIMCAETTRALWRGVNKYLQLRHTERGEHEGFLRIVHTNLQRSCVRARIRAQSRTKGRRERRPRGCYDAAWLERRDLTREGLKRERKCVRSGPQLGGVGEYTVVRLPTAAS